MTSYSTKMTSKISQTETDTRPISNRVLQADYPSDSGTDEEDQGDNDN